MSFFSPFCWGAQWFLNSLREIGSIRYFNLFLLPFWPLHDVTSNCIHFRVIIIIIWEDSAVLTHCIALLVFHVSWTHYSIHVECFFYRWIYHFLVACPLVVIVRLFFCVISYSNKWLRRHQWHRTHSTLLSASTLTCLFQEVKSSRFSCQKKWRRPDGKNISLQDCSEINSMCFAFIYSLLSDDR